MTARSATLGLLGAAVLTQSGCYLSHAALEQARILSGRRPIAEIVRDRSVPASTRGKLQLVLQARDFAAVELGLDAKRSFTAFTQIDRDTLLLVVTAARADVLQPHTWTFPIVGRVPYKGYFDFDAARREARELRGRGLDVYLRPADAYSTLGWFNDPLLSTTLARDSVELVKTVVHELTHNTFYAPGSADFNESFASFVGSRGAAAFFRSYDLRSLAERTDLRWEDERLLGEFWRGVAARLDSAFSRHPDSRESRLAARDTVYGAVRAALVTELAPRLRTIAPTYAERVPLNNAFVLAQQTYGRHLELFDAVLVAEGHDLARAIRTIIGIAESNPNAPFEALRGWTRTRLPVN